jgi:hypothetical protein
MSSTMLRRTVDGKVEEVMVMVWDGLRIMRGTPHRDGPQGSFEEVELSDAKAKAEAKRRIAALIAEGFVEFDPEAEKKAAAAAAPPKAREPEKPKDTRPSKARAVTRPKWQARLPAPAEKELAKIRKSIAKAGLAHRSAEIEALARPAITFSAKKAKPADMKGVVSRIGGDPDLPPGTKWPTVKGVPLAFVAQIVLADVKEHDLERVLPSSGVLSLFAQLDAMKDEYGERAFCMHFATSPKLVRTPAPEGAVRIATPALLTSKLRITLPPDEEPAVDGLRLTDDEESAYHDDVFLESIPEGAKHMLAGWANAATQHGMKKGRRFFAQIDSDDRIGFEMGDYETLRFYVAGDKLDTAALAKVVCTMSEA